jgi:hypothetical protein
VGGAAGAPNSLAAAEIAYNEQDDTLYYGKGNSGGLATNILPIAGPGSFLSKNTKLDELAAPTDVTTLNASTSAHGLLRKLDGTSTHYLDGTGNWNTPPANTGPAGVNAWALSTTSFTVPAVGATNTVTLADASWVVVGQMLYADTAGGGPGLPWALQVTAQTGNFVTLLNPSSSAGGGLPYDVALYAAGKPNASALVLRFVFNRIVAFGINLTGSTASVGTVPTASTVFALAKNGTSIGTLTFAAATATGTFSVAVAPNFVSGDVLTVTAPSTPDTTLADLSVTLTGTRA